LGDELINTIAHSLANWYVWSKEDLHVQFILVVRQGQYYQILLNFADVERRLPLIPDFKLESFLYSYS
jgi:hypothetical protein